MVQYAERNDKFYYTIDGQMLMFVDRFSNIIKIIKKAAFGIAGLVLFLIAFHRARYYIIDEVYLHFCDQ